MNTVVALHDETRMRELAAKRIRKLLDDWTNNTMELGKELSAVRESFPARGVKAGLRRPGWHTWLKSEAKMSPEHAYRLIRMYETFGNRSRHHRLSYMVMGYLSQRDITEEEREEVISRAKAKTGRKKLSRTEAKRIVEQKRLPSPKAANEQAKQEGRPVQASDGYIYFGASPEQAKEGKDRRTMVFGVRRALELLAGIQLTGSQFLNYALPHQLWTAEEGKVIQLSLSWLTSLDAAWEKWEPKKEPKS